MGNPVRRDAAVSEKLIEQPWTRAKRVALLPLIYPLSGAKKPGVSEISGCGDPSLSRRREPFWMIHQELASATC